MLMSTTRLPSVSLSFSLKLLCLCTCVRDAAVSQRGHDVWARDSLHPTLFTLFLQTYTPFPSRSPCEMFSENFSRLSDPSSNVLSKQINKKTTKQSTTKQQQNRTQTSKKNQQQQRNQLLSNFSGSEKIVMKAQWCLRGEKVNKPDAEGGQGCLESECMLVYNLFSTSLP